MNSSYRPADLNKVEFSDRAGLDYWMTEFGCSRDALFNALRDVGESVKDIRDYLILTGRVGPS